MADQEQGLPVGEPKPDVWLVLLVITLGATILATAIMWFESTFR